MTNEGVTPMTGIAILNAAVLARAAADADDAALAAVYRAAAATYAAASAAAEADDAAYAAAYIAADAYISAADAAAARADNASAAYDAALDAVRSAAAKDVSTDSTLPERKM